MKSTNRQFHLKLDQTTNYLKMCLLNCILISIVTLTHSLVIPERAQSTQMTLSSVIEDHPKFRGTLLNSTVVPFINQCRIDAKSTARQQVLCKSYYEMVKKLDASDANGLSTLDDFNKAMSVYNQTQIEEFCKKFPNYIPRDLKQYPESYKLFKYVTRVCPAFCGDETDIDNILVQPICRIFAIGYQLSDSSKALQSSGQVINITINKPQVEGNLNSESVPLPEVTRKSENKTSDIAEQGQDIVLAAVASLPVNKLDVVAEKKKVADSNPPNIPNEKNDAIEENAAKENSSPDAAVAEGIPAAGNGETESKLIASGNRVNEKETPTAKQELKPVGIVVNPIVVNPSENPTNNAQTAEKPDIIAQQPLSEANDEDKDYDDKTNLKGVTDNENDNFEDGDGNSKDKLANGVDSLEDGTENIDDEGIESDDQPAKNYPVQSSSKAELQNEDPFTDDTDSNFFTYFMFILLICVIAYVVYHNKSKMLALMLEGRRSSTNGRSGLSRRKHTAAYRKLDSNLEEAITSSANGRSTQVIY